ncbi:MAG: CDP-diacylglycerol--glycerol-3-phosphate 3-phosphatidyltransferase [Oscillospiraceae bacterium]|nr:CDP-diacylglycerol--glycerol-3-phosphate 3-phosphatidyltransferase [Oscillospiraceae bacterium]
MNLPNKLTVARIVLVPFFVFFLLTDILPASKLLALIVFVLASVTDALDGHIARSRNLVTTFGKFLDPLADKVLVISALVCFIELGTVSSVPVLIIIAREFMVSGLRLVTADKGVVVPANIWGKLKTAFTMVTIVLILFAHAFGLTWGWVGIAETVLIWISTVLTVISGWTYLDAYKDYIKAEM